MRKLLGVVLCFIIAAPVFGQSWQSESANVTSSNYPSNYPSNENRTQTFSKPGALKVRVHFSAFRLETDYDFIYIQNGSGSQQAEYTGSKGAFTSVEVSGDTLKVKFVSDYSEADTGWKVDRLEWLADTGGTGSGTGTGTGTGGGSDDFGGYYNNALGKTGTALKSALHNIIDDHKKFTYTMVWTILKEIDEDPENPDNVILVYTQRSQAKTFNASGNSDSDAWNREHTWPKSHGFPSSGQPAYTDVHHLRPADASVNSARGTKDFDYSDAVHKECSGCRSDTDSWEPPDAAKGYIARGMFYMVTRYEGDTSKDPDLEMVTYSKTSTGEPELGEICTVYEWHQNFPVTQEERIRNSKIYTDWQGNRNPFVDHPEWVEAIWGSQCGSGGGTGSGTGTGSGGGSASWQTESASYKSVNHPSNYPNDQNVTQTITKPGASKIRVHFSAFTLETDYDFVYIQNGSGAQQASYTGSKGAFTSVEVTGDTLKVKFASDYSEAKAGWKIDRVEWYQ